jgi:DNA-binding response OmpR family regulator
MKRRLCILLVEDDPTLGPMIEHALVALGHDSVLATTTQAVYKCLSRRHKFELVLLDLQLEDQRSEPIIEKLRNEGAQIPPIVILSALPVNEINRAVRAVGAKEFVQKPASIAQLRHVVDRVAA